jgi:hypothetical protein
VGQKITPEKSGVNVCGFSDRFVKVSTEKRSLINKRTERDRLDRKKGGFSGYNAGRVADDGII